MTAVFSATLNVTHDAPAGTTVPYPLRASVTNLPTPRIGLFSDPAIVSGRVRPPAFTGVLVNTTSAAWDQLLVVNDGSADGLDITEVSQSNSAQFGLTETCVSAPPLARLSGRAPACTVALRFTPTQPGQACTTVSIRAAASSNGVQRVEVCGTAVSTPVGASLVLSTTAIDFGRRQINATYAPQVLQLRNAASAGSALSILTLNLGGAGFVIAETSCQGATLAPGDACSVAIQFAPDPARPETAYAGTLAITSNDAQQATRTVTLNAIAGDLAPPPVLQITGGSTAVAFDALVSAGQTSTEAPSVVLRNAGPGGASVQAVRLVGPDASSFRATGCAPVVLAEGESCSIVLRFVPGSGGIKSAQLEIVSASSVTPALVSVTGRAVGGSSSFLTLSVSELAFANVRVDSRSEPLTLRLGAGGNGGLTVQSLQVQGPFVVEALSCAAAPFSLPGGAECSVSLRFAPTSEGAATGTLLVQTDAAGPPIEIPLRGNAAAKANASGGGCSMASGDTLFDPTLWALAVLALGGLAYRRRARRQATRGHR